MKTLWVRNLGELPLAVEVWYWQGVQWLAENEEYNEDIMAVGCRLTVMMLADMFEVSQERVGRDVVEMMMAITD